MRGTGIAIAFVLVAVLGGCGGSGNSERAGNDVTDEPEVRKTDFEGRPAQTFAGTREFCEMEPRSEFAVAEGLPADSSVAAIARRYSAEWPRRLRRAAFEGCMAGLATVPVRFPPSSQEARDIWERNFIVTSVAGKDDEPPVTRPIHIRVSFSNKRGHSIGWQARCNGFGGDVHFAANKMEVDHVGGTLMGCEPEIEAEDEWLSDFMEGDPEWRLDGERLQLVSDGATIQLKPFTPVRFR